MFYKQTGRDLSLREICGYNRINDIIKGAIEYNRVQSFDQGL